MLGNKEKSNKIAQKKATIFLSVGNLRVLQTIIHYVNMHSIWRAAGACNQRTVLRRHHTIEKTFTSSKNELHHEKSITIIDY